MPCYTHETEEEKDEAARRRFRHNSDVAEMLCDLLKLMPPGSHELLSPETQVWWKEHQERDAKRKGT